MAWLDDLSSNSVASATAPSWNNARARTWISRLCNDASVMLADSSRIKALRPCCVRTSHSAWFNILRCCCTSVSGSCNLPCTRIASFGRLAASQASIADNQASLRHWPRLRSAIFSKARAAALGSVLTSSSADAISASVSASGFDGGVAQAAIVSSSIATSKARKRIRKELACMFLDPVAGCGAYSRPVDGPQSIEWRPLRVKPARRTVHSGDTDRQSRGPESACAIDARCCRCRAV